MLVTQCGQKLQLLHAELEGQDLAAVMKEMEEEEVSQSGTMLVLYHSGVTCGHRKMIAEVQKWKIMGHF